MVNWYNIINRTEFLALGLPSKELTLNLTGLGEKTILVTSGNGVSLLYEGIFLTAELNGNNPFVFENHAIYIDSNHDIWLGIGT